MITNKIIKEEVEALKIVLTQEELNIPSFWNCIWPGLVCMIWFLLSSYLTYGISNYSNGLERIGAMIFAGMMGLFFLVTIANARGLYLSLPESFRGESIYFKFLARKCKCYGFYILIMFACSAFVFSQNHIYGLAFVLSTFFLIVVTVIIMNIDLGRYQLATLTSVVESVKNKKIERG